MAIIVADKDYSYFKKLDVELSFITVVPAINAIIAEKRRRNYTWFKNTYGVEYTDVTIDPVTKEATPVEVAGDGKILEGVNP